MRPLVACSSPFWPSTSSVTSQDFVPAAQAHRMLLKMSPDRGAFFLAHGPSELLRAEHRLGT
jgi:hypothetical protein